MLVEAVVRERTADDTQRIPRVAPPDRELVADRYEIAELIGRGGMAEVFAANDRRLGRGVAIKRPRRDVVVDAAISDRLQREASALAAIESRHVVAIHDAGTTDDGVYLVMQRLYGRTLDVELERAGPFTPARACRIGRDILAGLAAVHGSCLVHRDLKASNVLIDRTDRAVLLDLGAALHPRKRRLTEPGTVLGTPACLAPEQLAEEPLDGRVDLFQLGLILIFLVTGAMVGPGFDLSTLAVPPAMREVIARALAPVAARYTSAADMRFELDRALGACTLGPSEPLGPTRRTLRWPEPIPRP
jgi:serine/threonine protein kinase